MDEQETAIETSAAALTQNTTQESMDWVEKSKYAGVSGIASFVVLEGLLRAQTPGAVLALILGFAGWHFSEPLRDHVIARFQGRAPERKERSRHDLTWWLGGDSEPEPGEEPESATATEPAPTSKVTTQASMSSLVDHFDLGELRPHADAVFSNRLAILGMPNAGKSNTVAVFVEELARFRAPIIVFDQKPEYGAMLPYFPSPYRASAENITPANARAFGAYVVKKRLQVVLDLRSYKDDNTAARVMIEIINGVWAWEEERSNGKRIPCTFVLDEAHYWLPQSEQFSTVSRAKDKDGRSLFATLQQAFFNVVNGGRSFGLGIIISTQRPANIDNRAVAVAEWKILLKANMPNDLAVYKAFGVAPEVAMDLERGQAYLIGPGDIKGVYQLRRRVTPDESKTPGLAALKQPSGNGDEQPPSPGLAALRVSDVSPVSVAENTGNDMKTTQETATEADAAKIIDGVFPASKETHHLPETSVEDEEPVTENLVSADLMKAIRAMKEANYTDREIAKLTKLSGRKYGVYQQVLRQLGYGNEAKGGA